MIMIMRSSKLPIFFLTLKMAEERARNRVIRIVQTLDAVRRQVSAYLCRLIAQMAETDMDAQGVFINTIIVQVAKLMTSLYSARYAVLRAHHRAFPMSDVSLNAERDHDPTAQMIFAARLP